MGGMQDVDRKLHEKTQHDAYSLGPGEGDARWVMGELDTIKATAPQTGGLFGLKESRATRGSGPPLHVHEHEDEACYVLEGEVTFLVGDDVISTSTGTWVYLKRLRDTTSPFLGRHRTRAHRDGKRQRRQ
jgi:quercetin dioxygenase-like cupin family protein